MRQRIRAVAGCTVLCLGGSIFAQAPAPGSDTVVLTREQYNQLTNRLDKVETELKAVKEQQKNAPSTEDVDKIVEDVMKDAKVNRDRLDLIYPGNTNFLLTGYTAATYTNPTIGNSTFSSQFNPIFLWKLNDRLFFEGELELELEEGETATNLEYADISYIINDYVTAGAGKFLLPFGIFNERLHPAWINKLPDRPLPYADETGLAPEADIGAYLRGGAALDSMKINYAAYVTNGPSLNVDSPDNAGTLNFDNAPDTNDNKAVGGRIGLLPIPEFELGYSVQWAEVSPQGFENTNALLQALDASYKRSIDDISGVIDLRAEWVWSNVGSATYDPTGALGFGPVRFSNHRNSGYLQAGYRPTQLSNKLLKNTEFIVRYDMIEQPSGAPGGFDDNRWTFGLDYWVTSSFVLKAAYELDNAQDGAQDNNVFFLQAALGF